MFYEKGKIMKKIALIIMAALVIPLSLSAAALADGTPTFAVSEAQAGVGEEVVLTVSAENNPGIACFELVIGYDANVLEWVDVKRGSWSGIWDCAVGESALWLDADNNTESGALFTLTFLVKDGAPLGESAVTVSYDPDDVFDENENNVHFDIAAGGVEVVGDSSGTENDGSAKSVSAAESADEARESGTAESAGAAGVSNSAASDNGAYTTAYILFAATIVVAAVVVFLIIRARKG